VQLARVHIVINSGDNSFLIGITPHQRNVFERKDGSAGSQDCGYGLFNVFHDLKNPIIIIFGSYYTFANFVKQDVFNEG
jgi:hypothetical protein